MTDMIDRLHLSGNQIIEETIYDNSAVMEFNKQARASANEHGTYKSKNSGLVNVGKIHMGDVVRLRNMGYNLLSSDRDEVKRALLYIQENEKFLLTKNGKPISKRKVIWE